MPLNRENSLFFLLQNGPVLFESRQLGVDGKEEELSTAPAKAASSKRKHDADS